MTVLEFIQSAIAELHKAMIDDVKPLNQEHLTWKPAPKANPIGFLFWHFVRTEDMVIQSVQGKPAIWESEKWCDKLGLDAKAQGTGFQEAEVDMAAAMNGVELLAYAERVFQSTDDFIKTLDEAKVGQPINPERPRQTIASMVRNFVIAHGWWHLGEIKYLKGMQGMPAAR
jgi:hypothetical protein